MFFQSTSILLRNLAVKILGFGRANGMRGINLFFQVIFIYMMAVD